MIRIVLSYILPLVLPTLLYFGWMAWVRRKIEAARRAGEDVEHLQLKTPWIRLLAAGVVIMVAGLAVLATVGGAPKDSTYQPPRLENGIVKPGKFTPKQ